jgi:hypothetical protein
MIRYGNQTQGIDARGGQTVWKLRYKHAVVVEGSCEARLLKLFGKLSQFFLSARELATKVPEESQ